MVYRRYQEFRDLSDALRVEGYRVPVLPPKKLIGTLDMEFLRQVSLAGFGGFDTIVFYYMDVCFVFVFLSFFCFSFFGVPLLCFEL